MAVQTALVRVQSRKPDQLGRGGLCDGAGSPCRSPVRCWPRWAPPSSIDHGGKARRGCWAQRRWGRRCSSPPGAGNGCGGRRPALAPRRMAPRDHEMVGRVTRQGLRLPPCCRSRSWRSWPRAAADAPLGYDPDRRSASGEFFGGIAGVPPFLWFTVLRNFVTVLSRPMVVTVIAMVSLADHLLHQLRLHVRALGRPTSASRPSGLAAAIFCWAQFLAIAVYVARQPGDQGLSRFRRPAASRPSAAGRSLQGRLADRRWLRLRVRPIHRIQPIHRAVR